MVHSLSEIELWNVKSSQYVLAALMDKRGFCERNDYFGCFIILIAYKTSDAVQNQYENYP